MARLLLPWGRRGQTSAGGRGQLSGADLGKNKSAASGKVKSQAVFGQGGGKRRHAFGQVERKNIVFSGGAVVTGCGAAAGMVK